MEKEVILKAVDRPTTDLRVLEELGDLNYRGTLKRFISYTVPKIALVLLIT